jgi:hypothetical protein
MFHPRTKFYVFMELGPLSEINFAGAKGPGTEGAGAYRDANFAGALSNFTPPSIHLLIATNIAITFVYVLQCP